MMSTTGLSCRKRAADEGSEASHSLPVASMSASPRSAARRSSSVDHGSAMIASMHSRASSCSGNACCAERVITENRRKTRGDGRRLGRVRMQRLREAAPPRPPPRARSPPSTRSAMMSHACPIARVWKGSVDTKRSRTSVRARRNSSARPAGRSAPLQLRRHGGRFRPLLPGNGTCREQPGMQQPPPGEAVCVGRRCARHCSASAANPSTAMSRVADSASASHSRTRDSIRSAGRRLPASFRASPSKPR